MAQNAAPLKPLLFYPNKMTALLRLQVERQLIVLQHIKAVLPNNLANHVLHCVINDKKLLVYTDSAAWASQLRFHDQAILAAASDVVAAKPISILRVKVIDLPSNEGVSQSNRPVLPSLAVAEKIHEYSHSISDPQLKQALVKLSSTLARLQGSKS